MAPAQGMLPKSPELLQSSLSATSALPWLQEGGTRARSTSCPNTSSLDVMLRMQLPVLYRLLTQGFKNTASGCRVTSAHTLASVPGGHRRTRHQILGPGKVTVLKLLPRGTQGFSLKGGVESMGGTAVPFAGDYTSGKQLQDSRQGIRPQHPHAEPPDTFFPAPPYEEVGGTRLPRDSRQCH